MNWDWQTFLALVIVGVAAGFLVRRTWERFRRPTAGGCGGCGTGCSTATKSPPVFQLTPPRPRDPR